MYLDFCVTYVSVYTGSVSLGTFFADQRKYPRRGMESHKVFLYFLYLLDAVTLKIEREKFKQI